MKNILRLRFLFALLGVLAPLWTQAQTTFFTDNFSASTTNQTSTPQPGGVGPNTSTSYDLASTKNAAGAGASSIAPGDLHLALAATSSSAILEAQAIFTTNPIQLNAVGDYIDFQFTFTNMNGTNIFDPGANSSVYIGLYNSGATPGSNTNTPVAGGLAVSGLNTSAFAMGNCQPWQGYVAQINGSATVLTRPIQTSASSSDNQELLASGAGSGAYQNPLGATLQNASRTTPPALGSILSNNVPYLCDLRITVAGNGFLIVSNAFYQGNSTATGTLLFSQIGNATTTNSTFIASSFDGMAFGTRESGTPSTDPMIDVTNITITGVSTPVSGPPTILTQPVTTYVATNGTCAFSVSAVGSQVTYFWHRNNAPLSDSGNISGVTSSLLVVSNCTTADNFSGANGYYCTVTGAQGYFTNSTTNAMILIPSTNLVWTAQTLNGSGIPFWDVAKTINFTDTNGNQEVFNYGDPVAVNDAAQGGEINLDAPFIAAPTIVFTNYNFNYTIDGSGALAGPGNVVIAGSGRLTLNANDIYTGGTLISNANANVLVQDYGSFGTGPVVLGEAGGTMEIGLSGGANNGLVGTTVIASNFNITVDIANSFAAVFLGDISGTAGQTLSFGPSASLQETNQYRIRTYGQATVCNANLAFNDPDNNMIFDPSQTAGSETYNGIISGNAPLNNDAKTSVILNATNTYTAGTYPANGAIGLGISSTGPAGAPTSGPIGTGPLYLQGDSSSLTPEATVYASSANITVGNPIEFPSGTNNYELQIGGANNLTFSGPFTLQGNDNQTAAAFTNRVLQITNTAITTFSGVISDGGVGGNDYGLTVNGNGTNFVGPLILTRTETYNGPTTNSGAVLLINGQVGPGEVVVTNSGTLGGIGTITGPVIVYSNTTLTAGTQLTPGVQGIGTLTINNSLTFEPNSTNLVYVSGPSSGDSIVVSGALTYNGTLFATNIGAPIPANTQFHVLTFGSQSGTITVAGAPSPTQTWSFAPTTGILTVLGAPPSSGFTSPPGITNITLLSGTNVTISGKNGQSGDTYYLLTSTNLMTPINKWIPISTNIASGTTFSFTATNGVNPKNPQQFFIFANTNF